MSTTIDNRVVSMQFDNENFESNVQTSLKTIDKLKERLNFKGVGKSLEGITDSSGQVSKSFEAMENAAYKTGFHIEDIFKKVSSVLEYHVAGKIIKMAEKIASALTIDSAKAGFKEYETQMGAIQTILANTKSKGTTLDDVNSALDELNTYADKTIYNFTEMTKNIGTFTAAGVDLDTSVTAIKGIANLAAVSGSTSQQASTAMYQLSQALSSGTVRLMDWNSVVNAGMGGEVFQNALKETAKAHGVAIDDIIKKQGSFRESLSEGWLTSEILTETLAKFTDESTELGRTATDAATKVKTFTQLLDTLKETAQSGWAQTWELIVGDFEEAKAFLTEVSETLGGILGKSAESRNELLSNWKALGGRTHLIESIKNIFYALLDVINPIKEAFKEIFPPMTAEKLFDLTKGFKEFTEKLRLSDRTSDNLKRTFKGLFAIVDIARQLISALFNAIKPLLGSVGDLGGGILGITAAIGDWLVRLNECIKTSNIFNVIFDKISDVIVFLLGKFNTLLGSFSANFHIPGLEWLFEFFGKLQYRMSGVDSSFADFGKALKDSSMFKFLESVWKIIKTIGEAINRLFGEFVDKFVNNDLDGIMDFINSLSLTTILATIASLSVKFSNFMDTVKDLFGAKSTFGQFFDDLGGALNAWQDSLKADYLQKIAIAIMLLAAAILVLSFVKPERLLPAAAAITALFAELMMTMSIARKLIGAEGLRSIGSLVVSISIAVLVLAGVLTIVSKLSWEEIGKGLAGLTSILTVLTIVVSLINTFSDTLSSSTSITKDGFKRNTSGVVDSAKQMIVMAFALLLMCAPLKIISKMSWEELGKGLVGIISLLTIMGLVLVALQKVSSTMTSSMSITEKGMTKSSRKAVNCASQMVTMAFALLLLTAPLKIISTMSWEEIGKGMAGVTAALLVMSGIIAILSAIKTEGNMATKGAGQMLLMAAALLLLCAPLKIISAMSWEAIGKSLGSLTAALLVMTGIMAILGAVKGGAMNSASAILVVCASLAVLAGTMMVLSALSWKGIIKSLVAIAGAFVILGAAALVLSPIIGVVAALGTAMLSMGVGILAAGAGLLLFGLGLSAIAAGITALVGALIAVSYSVPKLVEVFVVGVVDAVEALILALLNALINSVDKIFELVVTIIDGLCSTISECAPKIVTTILDLIMLVLQGLAQKMPDIITALVDILRPILQGLVELAPDIAKTLEALLLPLLKSTTSMTIIMAELAAMKYLGPEAKKGVLEMAIVVGELALLLLALGGLAQIPGLSWIIGEGAALLESISGIFVSVLELTGIMAALAVMSVVGPVATAGITSMALVIAELIVLLTAIGALAQIPGLKWLIGEGGDLLATLGNVLGKVIGSFVGGIGEGLTNSLPQIATNLSDFMTNLTPFIDGAAKIDPKSMDGVSSLVGAIILLTAANVLDGIAKFITGGSSISEFGAELVKFGSSLKDYSVAVAGIDNKAIENSAKAAKALVEMTQEIPNEGGVVSWFTGDNSISKFGDEIVALGKGLKGFADEVVGLDTDAVNAAAKAGKALAKMTEAIPKEGGVMGWLAGEQSISKFGDEIIELGRGLKGFSDNIVGINPENVKAAAKAGEHLAKMTEKIPASDGVEQWFTGDHALGKFATEIGELGTGLSSFSTAIGSEGFSPENVKAGAEAAKHLAEMTKTIPESGGVKQWFTGDHALGKFGKELGDLGSGLSSFATNVSGIQSPEKVRIAAEVAKTLAEMTETTPKDTKKLSKFADNLNTFSGKIKTCFSNLGSIGKDTINNTKTVIETVSKLNTMDSSNISNTADAITKLTATVKQMAEDFKTDLKDAGKEAIDAYIKGISDKVKDAEAACTNLFNACVAAMKGEYTKCENAGKYLAQGFANGISANAYMAEAKAKAMARAAAEAAAKELDEHSPSRVGYRIGDYFGVAFVNAISNYETKAYKAGSEVASSARIGLSNAINKVKNLIDLGIDTQPRIRPVLDLSDIRSGAGEIGDMFGSTVSVGTMSNIGAIVPMMNRLNQNGQNGDLISAIDKLRRDLGNSTGNTYNINGVSYNDGDDVAEALKTIVRAAKVERRI